MRTLEQYEYLDLDALLSGVVEWIVKESPVLQMIPQMPIKGNSYKYDVELTLPASNWTSRRPADRELRHRRTENYRYLHPDSELPHR